MVSLTPEERPTINSPRDVYNLLGADMRYRDQEHLRVLLVSTNSEVVWATSRFTKAQLTPRRSAWLKS